MRALQLNARRFFDQQDKGKVSPRITMFLAGDCTGLMYFQGCCAQSTALLTRLHLPGWPRTLGRSLTDYGAYRKVNGYPWHCRFPLRCFLEVRVKHRRV